MILRLSKHLKKIRFLLLSRPTPTKMWYLHIIVSIQSKVIELFILRYDYSKTGPELAYISPRLCPSQKKKNKTRQKGYLLVVILIDSLSF